MSSKRVLIVGYDSEGHIGRHLAEAATASAIEHRVISPAVAFDAPALQAKMNWLLRGHRPTNLQNFGERVVARAKDLHATHVITTGIAPLDVPALEALRAAGIASVNWLTDDPWNRAHRAPWFNKTLPHYDAIFNPRSANNDDLARAGARHIAPLPFAYCPACHYPVNAPVQPVVSFVGGADADRLPYIEALLDAGVPTEVYGGYWDRHRSTRAITRGFLDMEGYRSVVARSAVSLCLVRAANRDEHVMRTYEIPAMRGRMLVQDTNAHRALFGKDGQAVRYFQTPATLVTAAQALLNGNAGRRLGDKAYARIARPENTYQARLDTLLSTK